MTQDEQFAVFLEKVSSVTREVLLLWCISPWTFAEVLQGCSYEVRGKVIQELEFYRVLRWENGRHRPDCCVERRKK
jgi:hypothetical protein